MSGNTQVVTSRGEQQKQLDEVTTYITKKYNDDIKEIIENITTDFKTELAVDESDRRYRYDKQYYSYKKNGELEITCFRNTRAELPAGKSVAEMFILHITQGDGDNANITIEVKGPSTKINNDLLLTSALGLAYPLNEIMKDANQYYKNLTQSSAPPIMGGRRSYRKTHKKSRKSYNKSRTSRSASARNPTGSTRKIR